MKTMRKPSTAVRISYHMKAEADDTKEKIIEAGSKGTDSSSEVICNSAEASDSSEEADESGAEAI